MKLYTVAFFCLMTLSVFGQVDKSNYSLLWEISGNGLEKPSYLFGTMHVQDERAHEFSDSTLICLDATDAFAMEVNIDSIMADILAIFFEGDTTNVLKQVMSTEAYNRLNKRMKEKTGQSIEEMENKDPMYLQDLLTDWEEPDYTIKKEQIVDMYLMKRAVEQGHAAFGLEELEDYAGITYSFFDLFESKNGMPDEDNDYTEVYEKMIEIYRSGDIGIIEKDFIGDDNADRSEYDIEMLDRRNEKMVTELEKLMKTQSVFCAVGTAHLPGKAGMLAELSRKGYKVRKVQADFEGYANDYVKTAKIEWPTFESTSHLYKVKVPGEAFSMASQVEDLGENTLAHMNMDLFDQSVYIHMVMNVNDFVKNADLENIETKFFENWNGGKGNEIQKSIDVVRSGKKGKRFYSTDEDGSQVVSEVFVKGYLVYMFNTLKPEGEIDDQKMEAFFTSIEFIQREWHSYKSDIGAFSVDLPVLPVEKRIIKPIPYDDKEDREQLFKTYISKDPITGINYIIRFSNIDEGMVVNDIKARLLGTIETISSRFDEPTYTIDSTMYTYKDMPAYWVEYELGKSKFDLYALNRGNRGMLIGVEYPKNGDHKEDCERFFNSFQLTPVKPAAFQPVSFEEGTYELSFPGKVITDRTEKDGYPQHSYYHYTAVDSMSSANFEMEVYHYNPFYMPGPSDSAYVDFQKRMRVVYDDDTSPRDTTFQGREALYSIRPYADSKNTIYEILFHEDLYLFNLSAILSDEFSEKEAWDYFNTFKNNKQYANNYLAKDKKDLLWKGLQSPDSVTYYYAVEAMNQMELYQKDLPQIYKLLEQDVLLNAERTSEVKGILLRELRYINDESTLAFVEKIFYKEKEDREIQLFALNTLAGLKSKPAFDLFFKLAADLPKDEAVNFEHAALFDNFIDTISLTKNYVNDLMKLTDDASFSYYVYDVLVQGCYQDSSYIPLIEPYLPELLGQVNVIIDENDLLTAKDSIDSFDYYYHFNRLNYLFGNFKNSKEIGQHYQRIENIPDAYLMVNIIDATLMRGGAVKPESFELVATNPYHFKRLLTNLNIENNLHKIPAHLRTPEKIVEAVAAKTIKDEYDTLTDFKMMETRTHTHLEKEYRIYIFTFGVKGYTGTYLGVCSQPLDEVQVDSNYFYYYTEEYDPEKKEESIAKILAAWED